MCIYTYIYIYIFFFFKYAYVFQVLLLLGGMIQFDLYFFRRVETTNNCLLVSMSLGFPWQNCRHVHLGSGIHHGCVAGRVTKSIYIQIPRNPITLSDDDWGV